ncbi:nucleotidyltransferase family protein [aff. Roholtiella sp. LEGE 12411]|uniref:nucleotidyltransferase family protein n=1 Tax=aff. Roholtiella sp. LEGE 12411 TaxID=1828822 RepID=UPI001FC7C4D9|nr:nucleotidyltransferase family protein [aff. Roholtiella sp. LEGE 12411]
MLVILCVHGSKHLWERLAWICDLAELIRIHQQTDWEQIMAKAKKLGTERMLLLGLYLAHNLLETTLPEPVNQRIRADLECQKLTFEVCQDFFNQTISQTEGFSFKTFKFHIRMMERQQDKIHYCIGSFWRWIILPILHKMMPTFQDQQFLSLPKYLDFLYYLIRPIRLTRNLVVTIWQRLFSGV